MKSYLTFKLSQSKPGAKTQRWSVMSDGYPIATIEWKNTWRRYVLVPNCDTIFDVNCLSEIINFINNEMEKRKNEPKQNA